MGFRRISREFAMQALFFIDRSGDNSEENLAAFQQSCPPPPKTLPASGFRLNKPGMMVWLTWDRISGGASRNPLPRSSWASRPSSLLLAADVSFPGFDSIRLNRRGGWDRLREELRGLSKPFQVCYEASVGYGALHDQLRRIAKHVVVAHPGQLCLIFRARAFSVFVYRCSHSL